MNGQQRKIALETSCLNENCETFVENTKIQHADIHLVVGRISN